MANEDAPLGFAFQFQYLDGNQSIHFMKILYTSLFALFLSSFSLLAQSAPKIGYVNVDYVIAMMPEAKTAQQKVDNHIDQMQKLLQEKKRKLEASYADYESKASLLSDEARARTEKDLVAQQTAYQQLQKEAEREAERKRGELLQGLYKKVQKAIDEVAAEHGYTQVFKAESLVYAADGTDIGAQVLEKLGVQ